MTDSSEKKMSVLIVDDDMTFRNRLCRALDARGYNALEAGNITQALAIAQREKPSRGVVDLRIGAESGLDLVSELFALNSEMDLIVMTGYGSIATAVEAMKRGAIDYLQKPCDADQIVAAFEKDHEAEGVSMGQEQVPSLARVEWEHIQRVLADCGGNISETARRLRIHRRSLQRKLFKMQPNE